MLYKFITNEIFVEKVPMFCGMQVFIDSIYIDFDYCHKIKIFEVVQFLHRKMYYAAMNKYLEYHRRKTPSSRKDIYIYELLLSL